MLALLQGNIPQDEKFEQGRPLALAWYAEQLRSETASLVVAPETAIPLLPQQLIPRLPGGAAGRYTQGDQAALLGIPLGNAREGYTNSVLGWRPAAGAAPEPATSITSTIWCHLANSSRRCSVVHRNAEHSAGRLQPGHGGAALVRVAGQRIAPNICYEDLFGEELAARFADPAQAPTVLVNFSNIGWFGNTLAVDQHLQISRMRALELERPMVRATNTGATVIMTTVGWSRMRWSASAGVFCAAKCTGAGWGCRAMLPSRPLPGGLRAGAVAAVAACWPGCGGWLAGQAPPIAPPHGVQA